MEVRFVFEHSTRNMSRYSETSPGNITRSLYLDTNALRQEFGSAPKLITVTIEETPQESCAS